MNLISKVRQKAVMTTHALGTYYERSVADGFDPRSGKPKKQYKAHEVLQGEPARRMMKEIPLRWTKWDEYIYVQGKLGLLSTYRSRHINLLGRAVYLARCDCGRKVRLTAQEIIARNRRKLGCCAVECTAVPIGTQIYLNPHIALRLQLSQLVARRPQVVDPYWMDNLEAAAERLLRKLVVTGQVDMDKGAWWIQGARQSGLNATTDVVLGVEPDRWMFPRSGLVARWKGKLHRLEDLASMFNVMPDWVLKQRLRYYDEELIATLTGEKS
jgi:hypothetical protein